MREFRATIKKNEKLVLMGLIVLTAIIYLPTLNYEFYPKIDDGNLILENETVKNFPNNISAFFTEFVFGLYHPFTTLSFGFDYFLFGENPIGYRIHSLLLHLLNVMLVFLFVKKLSKKSSIAIFSALIMAIHPMHIESVIWISERKDVLFVLYFLLSLLFYQKSNASKKYIYPALCYLFFLFSLLAKPTAVILPLALVLVDYVNDRKIMFKQLTRKTHLFLTALLFGLINIKAQNSIEIIQPLSDNFNLFQLVTIPVYAFSYYITQFFVPVGIAAKHFYPEIINEQIAWYYYLGWFWMLVFGAIVIKFRKNVLVVFGSLFYIIGIILVLKIIPTGNDIVSDRYSYLSYIGISVLFGILINSCLSGYKNKKMEYFLLTVFAIYFGIFTLSNVSNWKNEIAIWTQVIKLYPESALSYHYRGLAYSSHAQFDEALYDFNKAIGYSPNMHSAYNNRGLVKLKLKDESGALYDFSTTISIDSTNLDGYLNRGILYFIREEYDKAIPDLLKCKELDSLFFYTDNKLAIAYYKTNKFTKAIDLFYTIYKQDTVDFINLNYLANSYVRIENYESAIFYFDKILKLQPNYGGALLNRGNAYFYLNNFDEACGNWNKAAELGVRQAEQMMLLHCAKE